MKFYAPWCGHCQNLIPEYRKAAKVLEGVLSFVAVDATLEENAPLASKYQISGYPALKVFVVGREPVDYNGDRDSTGFVDWGLKEVKNLVKERQGGKVKKSSSSSNSKAKAKPAKAGTVIELNENNFEDTINSSSDIQLIAFVAPW